MSGHARDCEADMREYNKLTKELLAEGYSAECHPDYVMVGSTCPDKDNPLSNLDGGFVYVRSHIRKMTFRTPCGLQCRGESCMSSLELEGIEWTFENDMATVQCPYRIAVCEDKHESLPCTGVIKTWCNVHQVDEPYQYENSLEQVEELEEKRISEDKREFIEARKGRACEHHMYYDPDQRAWTMRYRPQICAQNNCRGYCPILGKELDKKRGNVFYDLKTTYLRTDLNGTLFEGQVDSHIEKGRRVFQRPVSLDICRSYEKLCKAELEASIRLKYHSQLFYAEFHHEKFEIDILNIRSECRASRDLLEDLENLKQGIKISFYEENEQWKQKQKKEARRVAQKKKQEHFERLILKSGYASQTREMQKKIEKILSAERIRELEAEYEKRIRAERERPVQLNLFEML